MYSKPVRVPETVPVRICVGGRPALALAEEKFIVACDTERVGVGAMFESPPPPPPPQAVMETPSAPRTSTRTAIEVVVMRVSL
jgi:hypothetical protein